MTTDFSLAMNPVLIAGPAGQLEAMVAPPPLPDRHAVIAILCHPHPLYQGNMNNKVVTTMARAFYDLNAWTIRFNFRGVGQSEGHYGDGKGEIDDLLAIIAWVHATFSKHTIWLAGFSFGAYIATHVAAARQDIAQLVTIAPAIHHFDFSESAAAVSCPWLLVIGDQDEVVSAVEVMNWVKSLSQPINAFLVPGVGHFFHGHLVVLRELLVRELQQ